MAQTIEERAKEYANKQAGGEYHTGFKGVVWQESYERYKEIATDQRKIDTDISCDWWINKLNAAKTVDYIAWEQEYRKFMEERRWQSEHTT